MICKVAASLRGNQRDTVAIYTNLTTLTKTQPVFGANMCSDWIQVTAILRVAKCNVAQSVMDYAVRIHTWLITTMLWQQLQGWALWHVTFTGQQNVFSWRSQVLAFVNAWPRANTRDSDNAVMWKLHALPTAVNVAAFALYCMTVPSQTINVEGISTKH